MCPPKLTCVHSLTYFRAYAALNVMYKSARAVKDGLNTYWCDRIDKSDSKFAYIFNKLSKYESMHVVPVKLRQIAHKFTDLIAIDRL